MRDTYILKIAVDEKASCVCRSAGALTGLVLVVAAAVARVTMISANLACRVPHGPLIAGRIQNTLEYRL